MTKKYTLEYLKFLLDRDNATLIGEYENIKKCIPIKFKCKCGNESEKQFQAILERTALCSNCVMLTRYEKSKQTKLKRYNNIINEKSLEAIIKKNKERSLITQEKWKKIEEQNTMSCITCKKEKVLDNFEKRNNALYSQWRTECKVCKNIRDKNNENKRCINNSLEYKLGLLIGNTKQRTKKRNKEALFNIDIEYLKELYNKQNGICYYSNKKMSFMTNSREKISIDRIDSTKWYEKGNIVLCCWTANNLKQDLTMEEFKEWIKAIHNKINV